MTPLYLNRIQISDFRTYGPNFDIDLEGGPGLTVVCGMNGLGKTAFFDAIEWALTDDIQRLSASDKFHGAPLTRDGASTRDSHYVKLHWGASCIERGAAKGGTSPQDIAALLKSPEWHTPITDPSPYLRLTHFLPQSSSQRFLKHDEKTKWSLLKGPAGVDRLEAIRLLLDDRKARNAFQHKIGRLVDVEALLAERQKRWAALLDEQKRLSELASMSVVVKPDQFEAEIIEMTARFSLETGRHIEIPQFSTTLDGIKFLREVIASELKTLHESDQDLLRAAEFVRRFLEAQQSLAATTQAKESLEKEISAITQSLNDGRSALSAARARQHELERQLRENDAKTAVLSSVMKADGTRIAALSSVQKINEEISSIDEVLESLKGENTRHSTLFSERASIEGNLAAIQCALMDHDRRFSIIRNAAQARKDASTHMSAISELEHRFENTLVNRQNALNELQQSLDLLRNIQEKIAVEQRDGDALTRAVSEIAAHISNDDVSCPVCSHIHPPGELLVAVRKVISSYNSEAGETIKRIAGIQEEVAAKRGHLQGVENEIEAIEKELVRVKRMKMEAELLCTPIEREALIANVSFERYCEIQEEDRKEFETKLNDISGVLSKMPTPEDLSKEKARLDSQIHLSNERLKRLRMDLASIHDELTICTATLESNELILSEHGGIGNLGAARDSLYRLRSELEPLVRNAKLSADELEQTDSLVTEKIRDAKARLEAVVRSVEHTERRLDFTIRDWGAAGFDEIPTEEAVRSRRNRNLNTKSSLDDMTRRLDDLTSAIEHWSRQEQLNRTNAEIQEFLLLEGVDSVEAWNKKLAGSMEENQHEQKIVRAVSQRASLVATKLKASSAAFSEIALQPLSERITSFIRILSPFDYRYNIEAHLTSTRARTSSSIDVPSFQSSDLVSRDADTWLSEGQSSALGLSVLLGASTVYRWSRWRALLLDDPLQSTDLIHAAAFADVVRGLISDEGYQVIVSTHSNDEADFLVRKCHSADIPVQQLSLLSLGAKGVQYSVNGTRKSSGGTC